MAIETQAFIDGVNTPAVTTPDAIKAAVVALVPAAGKGAQQFDLWAQLLVAAEMSELDPDVRARMEELFQTFGALRRQGAELEKGARSIAATLRQLQEVYARFKEAAAAAGYTV